MKRIQAKHISTGAALRGLHARIRVHIGQIAYYGAVALALTAIAFAAERYRAGAKDAPPPSALPAVEFAAPDANAANEADKAPLRAPDGAVLCAFSAEPIWSAALGLWQSHPATDYRLPGDSVTSLCAGVVRAVGKSGVNGGFVEVEGDGLLLRYASIAPRGDLAPGDELAPGENIGRCDASMPGEAALGPHLHLEAVLGEVAVDFAALAGGD